MTPGELKKILGAHKTEVLVVLDGLDEHNGEVPVLNQLLDPSAKEKRPWHSGCGLLVTTRPAAAAIKRARKQPTCNYELVGFAPDEMEQFIGRCIAFNTAKSDFDAVRRASSCWQNDAPDAATAAATARLITATTDDADLAAALAGAIEGSTALQEIYLCVNKICDAGVAALNAAGAAKPDVTIKK